MFLRMASLKCSENEGKLLELCGQEFKAERLGECNTTWAEYLAQQLAFSGLLHLLWKRMVPKAITFKICDEHKTESNL
jgi:hypothetical protein